MTTTPNGSRIVVQSNFNGTPEEVDVTEAVMALFDLAIGSMDYGSGFWTADDAEPVGLLAEVCGFESSDELKKYVEARGRTEREAAQRRAARLKMYTRDEPTDWTTRNRDAATPASIVINHPERT